MIYLIKLFFSIFFPFVAIFLCGAWTVVPEGINEKFSDLKKIFFSILWFLMAIFFCFYLVANISMIARNYDLCDLTSQCLLQKHEVLKINYWYFVPGFILYGFGCWFGVFVNNYLKNNNV